MVDRILVRLSAGEPASASWLPLDARGTPSAAEEHGPIDALAASARSRRVTLHKDIHILQADTAQEMHRQHYTQDPRVSA